MAAIAFFDHILACFGALAEILTNWEREFFRSFEALCTKALIGHYITSKNHLKIDDLTA